MRRRARSAAGGARLFREARRAEAEARSLYRAALAIGADLDLDTRLGRVLDATLGLLGVNQATVGLVDSASGLVEIVAVRGVERGVRTLRMPLGQGHNGTVVATNRPLRIADILSDSRTWDRDLAVREELRSWLGVPLADSSGAFGVLAVLSPQRNAFTNEHERLLLSFAALAGAAVREARLYQHARDQLAARERAEARAQRMAERLERLIEGTGDAVIASSPDGCIVDWNRGAEQMFGWTREEVLGGRPKMIPDELLEQWWEQRRRVLEQGCVVANYESERVTRAGCRIPVLITMAPLRDEQGRLVEVLGIVRDLSARRQLEEQAQRLARLEERERLAMDLHDGVAQALYGAVLGLAARERTLGANSHEARAALRQARAQVEAAIAEIRRHIAELRPHGASEPDLRAGLAALAERVRLHGTVRARLEMEMVEAPRLAPDAVAQLLGIAREATANVLRHAGAAAVSLRLAREGGYLVLAVGDDGRGFDPGATGRRAGDGLRNMAERARLLGGLLRVTSRPGGGTEVRVEVPLEKGGRA